MRTACVLLVVATAARADRYWVSPDGGDEIACDNIKGDVFRGLARKTPNKGLECLKGAGDRLTIRAGEYLERTAALTGNVFSGTESNPTIIEGEGDAGCALAHSCATVLRPQGGSELSGTNNLLIRSLEFDCTGSTAPCLRIRMGTGITLEDLELHHSPVQGLHLTSTVSGYALRRLSVHHNAKTMDSAGLAVAGSNGTIERSEIYENGSPQTTGAGGVQLYVSGPGADNIEFHHNIVRNNLKGGIFADGANASIHHNLVTENQSGGIGAGMACDGGSVISNNLLQGHPGSAISIGAFPDCSGGTAFAYNNLVFDNQGRPFVAYNEWTFDLKTNRLSPCSPGPLGALLEGSPCIDTGTPVSSSSYNGLNPDIGPFEAFTAVSAETSGDTVDIHTNLTANKPIQVKTTSGWLVDGHRVLSVTPLNDSDLRLRIDSPCSTSEGLLISYNADAGDVWDSALIGGRLNQPMSSFGPLQARCGKRSLYHCGLPGPLLVGLLAWVTKGRRR